MVVSLISSFRIRGYRRALGALGEHEHEYMETPMNDRRCSMCIYSSPLDDEVGYEGEHIARCGLLGYDACSSSTAETCQQFIYFHNPACQTCPIVSPNEVCPHQECRWIKFRRHCEQFRRDTGGAKLAED
jgi:hypothetical protein